MAILRAGNGFLLDGSGRGLNADDSVSGGSYPTTNLTHRWFSDEGVTADGVDVQSWVCQETGFTLTPYGTSPLTGLSPSGVQALNVNSGADGLTASGTNTLPTGNASRTIALCVRFDDGDFGGFAYGEDVSLQAFILGCDTSDNYILGYSGARLTGSAATLGQGIVLFGIFDTTDDTLSLYENNTLADSATVALNTSSGASSVTRIMQTISGREVPGQVYSIFVYSSALGSSDRQSIVDYCTAKWLTDVTAPSTSSETMDGATSSAFNFSFTADEAGTFDYIFTTDTGTPTIAQVEAGFDATGTSSAVLDSATGQTLVASSNSGTITGASTSTTYYGWVVVKDARGNKRLAALGNVTTAASATVPAAFSGSQWSIAASGATGTASVTIFGLPSDGGATITDIDYQIDGGAWVSTGGTTSFSIASGLTDSVAADVAIRAVNSAGDGTASATKSVTTTASSLPGYGTGGQAALYEVIGDGAQIPNIRPQTVPGSPTTTVTNGGDLETELAAASPGDVIYCTGGSYGAVTLTKNNLGNTKIRVICDWWYDDTPATFSSITADGLYGVSLENLEVTGSITIDNADNKDGGDIDILSCKMKYIYGGSMAEDLTVQYCHIDAAYTGGYGSQFPYNAATITLRNNIIRRAVLGDNLQCQGFTGDFVIEYNWIGDNATPRLDPEIHSDLVQFNGVTIGASGNITFRYNYLWDDHAYGATYQGVQGFFCGSTGCPSNGYNATVSENLISWQGQNSHGIFLYRLNGNVNNNTVVRYIRIRKGNGTNDNVYDNFANGYACDDGTGTWATNTGNVSGDPDTMLRNATGDWSSWRDFIPADDDYDKYTPFLQTLVTAWGD